VETHRDPRSRRGNLEPSIRVNNEHAVDVLTGLDDHETLHESPSAAGCGFRRRR